MCSTYVFLMSIKEKMFKCNLFKERAGNLREDGRGS